MVPNFNEVKTNNKGNSIFWLFFLSIFLSYWYVSNLYYVLYFFVFMGMLFNILKLFNHKHSDNIYDRKLLKLIVCFIIYTLFISVLNYKNVSLINITKIVSIYTFVIFILFNINVENKSYMITFYKYFTIIFNIFNIIDLYEAFTKTNLFFNFILPKMATSYGIVGFRAYSIFLHPIVYGMMLVILFWCNKFILKNRFNKLVLQIIVIVNLFFTQARSAWIAFAVTIILYCSKVIITKIRTRIKTKTKTKIKIHNSKIASIKICITIFALLVITICIIIFSKNIVDIWGLIYKKFITATSDSYGDVSRLQRLGTITDIEQYMFNNGSINFLFGNGFGTMTDFMKNIYVVIMNFPTSDNQYLSIFYEFGFVGLFLYITIIVSVIIKFFKNDISDINNLPILSFLIISVSMFFFESFRWTDVFILLIISMIFMCFSSKDRT